MDAITTFENNGKIGKIFIDESPDSPRNWDNLSKMICFHKRYSLGDKHDYKHADYNSWDEMKKAIIRKEKNDIILPLYLFDHSGITMKTGDFNDRFDSGQVGFIIISREKIFSNMGWKKITPKRKELLFTYLEGEVETYDQFLTGDVYGYKIEENGEETDSCWGFFGMEHVEQEVKSILGLKEEKELQEA